MCGRTKNQHDLNVAREDTGDQWTPERCTRQMQTDAYGEIDFLGTGSQNKRSPVSHCRPWLILYLLWCLVRGTGVGEGEGEGYGFPWRFQQEGNWFSQAGKTYWTEFLCRINFSVDGQTRWKKKPSSQPVNLPSAWPLIKPLGGAFKHLMFIREEW